MVAMNSWENITKVKNTEKLYTMKKRKYFRITFSCSEDELRAIRQTAADCGMSMSMYCKKVVLGFKPKYRLSE